MKAALIAGVQSGCGKTSCSIALLQSIQKSLGSVTAFKAGPDFLDPMWHQAVTGKSSYNLDTLMVGTTENKRLLANANSEFALVEGVMGLFDGRSGVGGEGSSAHLAKQLNLPVLLVVDVKGMSGSIVPLVSGFVSQAKALGVNIAGIIANRVGSAHHKKLIEDFLEDFKLPPLIAYLLKDAPCLPERHLGLQRPDEVALPNFAKHFHLQTDKLKTAWADSKIQTTAYNELNTKPIRPLFSQQRIAVAKDQACCFIYQANIDWLLDNAAELVYFSPLAGEPIPKNTDILWLPGGYPELYAQTLSKSTSWASIHTFIESGKPALAECGGMMLLGKSLVDLHNKSWPMADVLPFTTKMQPKLASLGYRNSHEGIQGHEYHHSKREDHQTFPSAFKLARGDNGIRYKNLRASYVHWYFSSAPSVIADWFKLKIKDCA